MNLLGFDDEDTMRILKISGAGPNPFGYGKWPKKPHIVFKNLAKIEKPISYRKYLEFINYYKVTPKNLQKI